MYERLDTVGEVDRGRELIAAEVPLKPPGASALPGERVLLAAQRDAEALGLAAAEEIEEARADTAAEIQDSGPRGTESSDLFQHELVDEMKRRGPVSNAISPDGAV